MEDIFLMIRSTQNRFWAKVLIAGSFYLPFVFCARVRVTRVYYYNWNYIPHKVGRGVKQENIGHVERS